MAPTQSEFVELIQSRLKQLNVSAIRAARSSGISRDAIRAVIRGRSPTYNRIREICLAPGLHFEVSAPDSGITTGTPRQLTTGSRETTSPDTAALSRFTTERSLEVRHLGAALTGTAEGDLTQRAPAPADLADPHAFYAVAGDESMRPAGIEPGDYLLVLPNDAVRPQDRVWVRQTDSDTGSVRWLINWWEHGFEIVRWEHAGAGAPGRPGIIAEQMPRRTTEVAAIAAVYRGRPSTGRTPMMAAHWP